MNKVSTENIPDDPETASQVWYLRALEAMKADEYGPAEYACRESLRYDPDSARGWECLAMVLWCNDNNEGAKDAMLKTISLGNISASVWHTLGRIYVDLNLPEQAESAFQEALALESNHEETLYSYALLLVNKEEYLRARELIVRMLKYNIEHMDALLLWGICWMGIGRIDVAEQIYELVIEKDPTHAKAYLNLASVYILREEWYEAEGSLLNHLELDETSVQGWLNMGYLYFKTENYEMAERSWMVLLDIAPNFYDAVYNLGQLYLETGDTPKAMTYFDRAIAIDPTKKDAQEALEKMRQQGEG